MNENLNVTLKMLMVQHRISNEELAQRVGISKTLLSLIINGRADDRLKLRVAQRIARELGTTTDELWPLPKEG